MSRSKNARAGDDQFLISRLEPGRAQNRLAFAVVLVLVVALGLTVPFARIPLDQSAALLPAYGAAILVNEMITAAMLLSLHSVERSRAILLLAVGYLFSGLMAIPWALTFPGVFSPDGLLGAGPQSTAAIATLRRVGLPLFVLGYALLKDREPVTPGPRGGMATSPLGAVLTVAAAAVGLTWIAVAGDDALPRLMLDNTRASVVWQVVAATAALVCLAALAMLWVQRRTVLDLWLMVVICTSLIEIALLAFFSSGRFSVGWWAGRLYGLASASLVLLVLLSETTTLYARLVRSLVSERRSREERVIGMEALSASIAHEVNQPLASMVTNADAGLRWLGQPSPDLDEVRAALRRIAADGHRAAKVIGGIRSIFRKGAEEWRSFDMNALVHETLRRSRGDIRLGRVSVEIELNEHLPPVTGNPVQIQQVLTNLVSNAVEAMDGIESRSRVLRIRSEPVEAGAVLVSVEDSGPGMAADQEARTFEPFFTTKPHGMGMGLTICRSIVEAHGGRLWIADDAQAGAVVRFSLPCDVGAAPPGGTGAP